MAVQPNSGVTVFVAVGADEAGWLGRRRGYLLLATCALLRCLLFSLFFRSSDSLLHRVAPGDSVVSSSLLRVDVALFHVPFAHIFEPESGAFYKPGSAGELTLQ